MAYVDLVSMLGYTNNAKIMMETFKSASNVVLSDNPEYTQQDFSNFFPLFVIGTEEGSIPLEVYNLFYNMANASIKYDRYYDSWKYLMSLYIAHMSTLYLNTSRGDPGATSALQNSLPKGIASSKSVDGLSISYDFMGMPEDFSGYGAWKLTIYGQQLITMTKMYGHGGMWING